MSALVCNAVEPLENKQVDSNELDEENNQVEIPYIHSYDNKNALDDFISDVCVITRKNKLRYIGFLEADFFIS